MFERTPGKRQLHKIEAIRHVLHAAIRMHFAGEDPFAIHLLAQSADKLTSDYCKAKSIVNPIDLENIIRQEYRAEVFRAYRETYNYFKHSNKDADCTLEVREISASNELVLFAGCVRFGSISDYMTKHIQHFLGYYMTLKPSSLRDSPARTYARAAQSHLSGMTGREILAGIRSMMLADPEIAAETTEDLKDAVYAEIEL